MQRLLRECSTPGDSQRFATGALVFGGLLFTAGVAPWALPFLYLLFIACAVPWRAWDFSKKKGTFFLLDFCYVSCCCLEVVDLKSLEFGRRLPAMHHWLYCQAMHLVLLCCSAQWHPHRSVGRVWASPARFRSWARLKGCIHS